MKAHEILGQIRPRAATSTTRRPRSAVQRCLTVQDVHALAVRRLPRPVADYVDGGADEERTLRGNRAAFERWSFLPSALRDVSSPTLSTRLLGKNLSAPIGLAPTGYTRMIDPAGELGVQGAAAAHGVPYVLSTMATTSIETLAAAHPSPSGGRWFQLYVWRNRDIVDDLVARAAAAEFDVLEIAVDTAVPGNRLRDRRAGLTIPPRLGVRGLWDIGQKPRYWSSMLRHPVMEFANVRSAGAGAAMSIEDIGNQFDPAVTWDDIRHIRAIWPGKLMLKGPISPSDARQAIDEGFDGLHLSNHGGRQLDRTLAALDLVAPVRDAVGWEPTIVVDSGIRHGADIAVCLALGADAVFIGRPYLWGLAAGGQDGVGHVLTLLESELERTMQLLGVTTVDELRRIGHGLLVNEKDASRMAANRGTYTERARGSELS